MGLARKISGPGVFAFLDQIDAGKNGRFALSVKRLATKVLWMVEECSR
jgi:hypothetical protein